MTNYNVYEQRRPTRIMNAREPYWEANLAFMGQLRANDERQAMEQARSRFMVRHPVLHELDENGDERRYQSR